MFKSSIIGISKVAPFLVAILKELPGYLASFAKWTSVAWSNSIVPAPFPVVVIVSIVARALKSTIEILRKADYLPLRLKKYFQGLQKPLILKHCLLLIW